jgi:UDP-glucose:(heptosyl)LPS alpha-1,3-glucosyltransferase
VKIALVILHADPARGGAERYTADIAAALAVRGQDVSILAGDFGPAIPGVKFVPLDAGAATRRGKYARFLDSLDAHLSSQRHDIVHAMAPVRQCDVYHPHAGLAVATLQSGHLKHARPVTQAVAKLANRLNGRRQLLAEVEARLLNSSRPPVVLCLSDYVKRSIASHFELPQDRLATLFNAVDLSRFDPARVDRSAVRRELGIAEDRIVALMVAQDFARKGLRQAIEAIARLGSGKPLLLVVGKDQSGPYEQLAARLGISEHVRLIGPVSDARKFYGLADFFVLPTRHDPCSLVVLESLAMGLPVISTVFNGACEIMHNGEHGFVLPDPSDVTALANAISEMLDAPKRNAMRQACLALRPSLSLDAHIDRLLAIYASCKSFSQKSTAR